jgi:hypothetical protein
MSLKVTAFSLCGGTCSSLKSLGYGLALPRLLFRFYPVEDSTGAPLPDGAGLTVNLSLSLIIATWGWCGRHQLLLTHLRGYMRLGAGFNVLKVISWWTALCPLVFHLISS